ncbi:MAG: Holliday junction resolvase RecU [Bacilli bacterium]|nr:Holliday junction resolvase RecU [Bacilli bacterium]
MKYPNGLKKKFTSYNTYANRGMSLESDIGSSNEYYLLNDIAVVYKKPTPITIAKVDYPSRVDAVIKEAYFKTPSTTDYNGIYKGKYIDFEAKETKNKTSFPLNNIHSHQIKHLQNIYNHGGIGFIIVRFTSLDETYLLTIEKLTKFLDNNRRKSIPLEYFKENGYFIKQKFRPLVDYIEIIDKIYFDGGNICQL